MAKVTDVHEIKPELSRCIEVESPDRLFAIHNPDGKNLLTHNSVVQRNIVFSCIMRPKNWRFLGIDLKRVELSAYKKYSEVVLGIATTLEDAITVLRFASQLMMTRYEEMESQGYNNIIDMPGDHPAILIMIDEYAELVSSGSKALAEDTLVWTPSGLVALKDLQEGDIVLDNRMIESKIKAKYEPHSQDHYELEFIQDSTGGSESFIAGEEHLWVVYLVWPDGAKDEQTEGPFTVTTRELAKIQRDISDIPEKQQPIVKVKRARV